MNQLSDNALTKLDEMLATLEPVISFLHRKISDKSITGQIDIQRIRNLDSAYNEFLNASHE